MTEWSVSTVEKPTARKPHTCDVCSGAIPVGSVYQRTSGLNVGHWTTHKWCRRCVPLHDTGVRPEDAAAILADHHHRGGDPRERERGLAGEMQWFDPRVIRVVAESVYSVDVGLYVYEAVLVPRFGWTRWKQIGGAWKSDWNELNGGSRLYE